MNILLGFRSALLLIVPSPTNFKEPVKPGKYGKTYVIHKQPPEAGPNVMKVMKVTTL